jgi:hypothetical protein
MKHPGYIVFSGNKEQRYGIILVINGSVVVEALGYKPEDRGFYTR